MVELHAGVRRARLLHIDLESGDKREIAGVPDVTQINQGGLLDVTVHREFADNRWVYLSYSVAGEGG